MRIKHNPTVKELRHAVELMAGAGYEWAVALSAPGAVDRPFIFAQFEGARGREYTVRLHPLLRGDGVTTVVVQPLEAGGGASFWELDDNEGLGEPEIVRTGGNDRLPQGVDVQIARALTAALPALCDGWGSDELAPGREVVTPCDYELEAVPARYVAPRSLADAFSRPRVLAVGA